MAQDADDDLLFIRRRSHTDDESAPDYCWRILIVDDDRDVHEATGSLSGVEIPAVACG